MALSTAAQIKANGASTVDIRSLFQSHSVTDFLESAVPTLWVIPGGAGAAMAMGAAVLPEAGLGWQLVVGGVGLGLAVTGFVLGRRHIGKLIRDAADRRVSVTAIMAVAENVFNRWADAVELPTDTRSSVAQDLTVGVRDFSTTIVEAIKPVVTPRADVDISLHWG